MIARHISAAGAVSIVGIAFVALGVAGTADAKVRPFVYGGGSSMHTIREEEDELLLPVERKSWLESWEAGAGLHVFSETPAAPRWLRPVWEVRVRGGFMSGGLDDVHVEVHRDRAPFYDAVIDEKYDYSGLQFGAVAVARFHEMLGIYLGPSLQRIKLRGELSEDWSGDIPEFCTTCVDREDDSEGTVLYGLIEVGARLTPLAFPAALEAFWIPHRVQMSSTIRPGSEGWIGDFAELNASVGARITYDF